MHRFIFTLVFLFVLASFSLFFNQTFAATGEELFQSLGCNSCHKPDKKAVGVSLSIISTKYKSEDNLVKFFKGESKPIIEKDLPMMMQGQMGKIEALSEEDKKVLAGYILGFK